MTTQRVESQAMAVLILSTGALFACSDPSEPRSCGDDGIELEAGICLILRPEGAFEPHRGVIEQEVVRTLDAMRLHLAVSDLRIVFLTDATGIIPEIGLGGFNPSSNEVRIYLDPQDSRAEGIVRSHLVRILSHEVHHALRRRGPGYGSSLFQAAVTEGLADHFSLEVGGGDPAPWSLALSAEGLATWLPQVVARTGSGYDRGLWFLGTSSQIPRWTGYAVGFELVRRYLELHPNSSAAGLVHEPAASFRPPTE